MPHKRNIKFQQNKNKNKRINWTISHDAINKMSDLAVEWKLDGFCKKQMYILYKKVFNKTRNDEITFLIMSFLMMSSRDNIAFKKCSFCRSICVGYVEYAYSTYVDPYRSALPNPELPSCLLSWLYERADKWIFVGIGEMLGPREFFKLRRVNFGFRVALGRKWIYDGGKDAIDYKCKKFIIGSERVFGVVGRGCGKKVVDCEFRKYLLGIGGEICLRFNRLPCGKYEKFQACRKKKCVIMSEFVRSEAAILQKLWEPHVRDYSVWFKN